MPQEERNARLRENVPGGAAEDPFAEARTPVGPHHQHLRVRVHGVAVKHIRDGVIFPRQTINRDLDAVAGKEGRDVGARLLPVRALASNRIDDGQPDLVGRGKRAVRRGRETFKDVRETAADAMADMADMADEPV